MVQQANSTDLLQNRRVVLPKPVSDMFKRFLPVLAIFLYPSFTNAQQLTDTAEAARSFHAIKTTDSKTHQFKSSLLVSVPLIATGILMNTNKWPFNKQSIQNSLLKTFPGVHTKADNYIQYAPTAVVFGLTAFGLHGRHDAWNQSILLLKAELITNAIVFPIKNWTKVKRPDGSDNKSFPSGHSAQAFLAAEFLRKEYGSTHPWIAVGGYVAATSVAALRVLKNRHWVSDVLEGAGIGILSVNLAYLTHQNKWPLCKKKLQVMPTYTGYGPGIYMHYQLGK